VPSIEALGMTSLCVKRLTVLTEWMKRLLVFAFALLSVTILLHLNLRFDFETLPGVGFIGECILWIVISVVLMSFIEHQIHLNLMHKMNFLSRRKASIKRIFEAHAIVHHQHYSNIFCDEPVGVGEDKEIRLTVHKAPIKAIPIAALIALVSWHGALIFMTIVTFHHWVWNKIHLEMHKPEKKFFSSWPVYKFLARHHYLHHRYQDRNFNVVFPLADYFLRTNALASKADLTTMNELGLF
jgi:hypothetical protein